MDEEDDDNIPQLSGTTLALLKEFNEERDARTKQFENAKAESEANFQNGNSSFSMDLFGEDWNASQFWYTDETATILAQQLLKDLKDDDAIAVVSAPSVYAQLNRICTAGVPSVPSKICLLEFDARFNVFGSNFVPYDYQSPLRLPPELKGKFTRIICDPPFLSEDCQAKTALTVRYLARTWMPQSASNEGLQLMMCTGERMEATVLKLYSKIGVATTTFEPQHSRGLSNEFRCYANFECNEWTWR